MNFSKIIRKINNFVREYSGEDFLHGYPHVCRVRNYGLYIQRKDGGNPLVIEIACLLHDLGHKVDYRNHPEISVKIATPFLKRLDVSEKIVDEVAHCIKTHSRQFSKYKPNTLEAKILYDADGLDLLGSIGAIRAILSCTQKKKGLDCILRKLGWRLKEAGNFYTPTGRKLADSFVFIIKKFYNDFYQQLNELALISKDVNK